MGYIYEIDPYAKKVETKVLKSSPSDTEYIGYHFSQRIKGYEIILDDTVLFPEGGGQPHDTGYINDIAVIFVFKRDDQVVHVTLSDVNAGQEVHVTLDWERRWDHMQQHSGQHLLSAVLEKQNYETLSWSLGPEACYVELSGNEAPKVLLQEVEKSVNEHILQDLPITKILYASRDEFIEGQGHMLNCIDKLPLDVTYPLKMVCIAGVDENLCCGTHVRSTLQLQNVKVLGCKKGNHKGSFLLHFVCGGRLIRVLDDFLIREAKFNALLKSSPENHVPLVEKIQKSETSSRKLIRSLLKEIVDYDCTKLQKIVDSGKLLVDLHRKEVSVDHLLSIMRNLNLKGSRALLTCGENCTGAVVLSASAFPPILLNSVCHILEAKGSTKDGVFQGKAGKLQNRNKALKAINDFVSPEC